MSVNTIPTRNQQSNEYLERNQEILQSVPIFLAHTLVYYIIFFERVQQRDIPTHQYVTSHLKVLLIISPASPHR